MNSIFIIHLFSLFKYFNSYILFPIFSKENPELNYIENLINSSIYTNISIGTPIQTIPMNIKLDDKYFFYEIIFILYNLKKLNIKIY